jgi:hypothetical protein
MGPERKAPEVLVEPGRDDAGAAVRERERRVDDGLVEELHLVDADHVEAVCTREDVGDAVHRDGAHAHAGMAHDVGSVVAVVDPRLEDDHALTCDLGPAQPADHLLALAAEHGAANDLQPAASLWWDADHGIGC